MRDGLLAQDADGCAAARGTDDPAFVRVAARVPPAGRRATRAGNVFLA